MIIFALCTLGGGADGLTLGINEKTNGRKWKSSSEEGIIIESIFNGNILSGTLNEESHEITITQVKQVPAWSVWEEKQLEEMLDQARKAIETNQQTLVITVRDSLPMLIQEEEIEQLYREIMEIKERLNL
ncbi:hypothetical protein [Ammoniphilus sp. 3BR4]|uniref:hypothetical protein n=1 Tax=Ammoniphilus sp. 3BR4 TaxID=3158265 RepID=UPI003467A227